MNTTAKEEAMYAGHRQDLAHRRGDGIDVILWWSPEDDTVAVEVMHLATDSSFELVVERSRALDAFLCRAPEPRAAGRRRVNTHHRWSLVTVRS